MMEENVVKLFLDKGYQLSPEAINVLRDKGKEKVNEIILGLSKNENNPLVITPDIVKNTLGEKKSQKVRVKKRRFFEEIDSDIDVLEDSSDELGVESSPESFMSYFKSRYDKMSSIFKERMDFRGIVTIKEAREMQEWEKAKIVGMVYDKRITKNGNIVILLEDLTSRINLVITKKQVESFKLAEKIVLDEIIGVEVTVRSSNYWFTSKIQKLEISPMINEWRGPEENINAVLISDIHAGSKMFQKDVFFKFIDWLKGNNDKKRLRNLADHTKYIVVAGDLIDGIGIYPGQEKELDIYDVSEQYEYVAHLFEEIPEDMKIIVSPGNHDAVRRAEPQPKISKELAPDLYSLNNIQNIGNPSLISLHGVKTLVYHGRSLDTLLNTSKGADINRPEKIMIQQLKMRHLNCSYGMKTPIAPETTDNLVIGSIPNIFHSGHVHINGNCFYRGTAVVNSGAFQAQTQYQSKLGITPTPGRVPIVNLSEGILSLIKFS